MLAELENISYYVQTPGHNKRFSGHNSGGINYWRRHAIYMVIDSDIPTGNPAILPVVACGNAGNLIETILNSLLLQKTL